MIIAMMAVGGLAACTTKDLPSRPTSGEFVVEPIRLSHQVTFATDTVEMAPAAPDELLAFLDEVDPDRKAEVYLDAGGPLRNERMDAVAAVLSNLGRTPTGTGGAAVSDFGVTVTVADNIVLPASCMDHDLWPDPNLPPASCTTALTLVRMVEDPDDLIQGRELGPASSTSAADAAARLLERRGPSATELPASVEAGEQQLPPSSSTQDASY
jgi:hypothetical protein